MQLVGSSKGRLDCQMANQLPAGQWLSQDVAGLAKKSKEEMKLVLLNDLDRHLGVEGERPMVVEEEIDRFLKAGRVSNSNLRRLQRRLQARLFAGDLCDRSESSYSARTEASEKSRQGLPQVCNSARGPRDETTPQKGAGGLQKVPEDEMLRWSQIAKLATKEAEMEAAQKRKQQDLHNRK